MTKYIRIGIGDKNDNPPYFDQAQYEAEVNEDEEIQRTVITVTAKDKTELTKSPYEITRGKIGGAFAMKNETSTIYPVIGTFDFENRKEVSSSSLSFTDSFVTLCVSHVEEKVDIHTHKKGLRQKNGRPLYWYKVHEYIWRIAREREREREKERKKEKKRKCHLINGMASCPCPFDSFYRETLFWQIRLSLISFGLFLLHLLVHWSLVSCHFFLFPLDTIATNALVS